MYMQLPGGRVIIEMEPALAPHTVANIEALVRMHYFDGAAVVRVQDNFVAQWSQPGHHAQGPGQHAHAGAGIHRAAERGRLYCAARRDGYAPQVGFIDSFPAARDPAAGRAWLAHCYGAVGVGRDNDPATGNGSELYAVIGHAPRQLDRNVTVVGRVRQGIELLASLPRGTAPMGFYAKPAENIADQPRSDGHGSAGRRAHPPRGPAHRYPYLYRSWSRRAATAPMPGTCRPAGYIDLCSAPLPVRAAP